VQIEPRIEAILVEVIDGLSVLFGNVRIAHMLSDDTGILALR
jgi:hypothetical protein